MKTVAIGSPYGSSPRVSEAAPFGLAPASPRNLHRGCCAATTISIMTAGRHGYVAEITRVLSQTRHLSVTNNEGLRAREWYAIDARMSAFSYASADNRNLRESAQPDQRALCGRADVGLKVSLAADQRSTLCRLHEKRRRSGIGSGKEENREQFTNQRFGENPSWGKEIGWWA